MFIINNLNRKLAQLLLFIFFSWYQSFGQSNQINGFNIPRLSPVPASVSGVQQAKISLNGQWNFQIEKRNVKQSIKVPGEWEMQGFTVNEGETAVYSRELYSG